MTRKTVALSAVGLLAAFVQFACQKPVGNQAPAVPVFASAPDSGGVDSTYEFRLTTTDPDQDKVMFRVAWGDGDTASWSSRCHSGDTMTFTHSWDSAGSYSIAAQAKDAEDNTTEWTAPHSIAINAPPNHPPETPEAPEGLSVLVVGSSLTITTHSSDPDRDSIAFRVDWGDGDTSAWSRNYSGNQVYFTGSHPYDVAGVFQVRAQARDFHSELSGWSVSHTVTVNTADFPTRVLKRIGGMSVHSLVLLPDGSRLYATGEGDTTFVIDTDGDSVVTKVSTPGIYGNPGCIAASRDGSRVYVSSTIADVVWVIRTSDNVVYDTVAMNSGPSGFAVLPSGEYFYVVRSQSHNVAVVRTSDNSVVATVAVGQYPQQAVATLDGQYVYVSSALDNVVSVIRTSDNTVVGTIPVSLSPRGIALAPAGEFAYVVNFEAASVTVIRTSDRVVVSTVQFEGGPDVAACLPDGRYLYVSNYGVDGATVIRLSDNTVAGNIFDCGAGMIAPASSGQKVYIAGDGGVTVLGY